MKTRLLLAILLLAALAACKFGGSTETPSAPENCTTAGSACQQSSNCCSYACSLGVCQANPVEGGLCRTSPDCASGMLCKSGACTTGAICRDDADVCGSHQACCSGLCLGSPAACTPNHAPEVELGDARTVPYNATVFPLPAPPAIPVSDPDFDAPLVYVWTLVSKPTGSAATISNPADPNPSFFADVRGDYTVRLGVTDGPALRPGRLTTWDEVILHADNLPPVVDAGEPIPNQPRNVPVMLVGTVSDPNGAASLVTCQWKLTPPGGTEANASSLLSPCPAAPQISWTPPPEGPEGDWTFRLVASDGEADANDTRLVTVVNNPPNAALARIATYANLSGPAPVELDATASLDVNGDALTFLWEPLTWPGQGGGAVPPALDTTNPRIATFTPADTGDYTIRLTVSDPPLTSPPPVGTRPSTSTSITASVHVARAIQDLGPGGEVVDADVAHGLGTSGTVVIVGPNPANGAQGMLREIDLATQAVATGVVLGQTPTCAGVSPDGTVAVVASASFLFVVPLDGSPMSSLAAPWAVSDVVVTGDQGGGKHVAYVFPVTTTNPMQVLDINTMALTTPSPAVYGQKGALNPVANRLYVRESAGIRKLAISGGGNQITSAGWGAYPTTTCMHLDLWTPRPTEETHIFTGCGDVVAVPTATLTVTDTLAATSVRHLDTAPDGAGVYVATGGTSVLRFDPFLVDLAPDALPHWSWDGVYRATSGLFTFTDGTSRWAIVQGAPGGSARAGLVEFP
jgi:hypothetical protein